MHEFNNFKKLSVFFLLALVGVGFFSATSSNKFKFGGRAAVFQQTPPAKPQFEHFLNIGKKPPIGFLNSPRGMALSTDQNRLYVVDSGNARIQVFNTHTFESEGEFGSRGMGMGEFWDPQGIAVAPDESRIFVTDAMKTKVQIFEKRGNQYKSLNQFGGPGKGQSLFVRPLGVKTNASSDIFVVDYYPYGKINVFTKDGEFIKAYEYDKDRALGKLEQPTDLDLDPANSLMYVLQTQPSNNILKINTDKPGKAPIGGWASPYNFNLPVGVKKSSQESDPTLYMVDLDDVGSTADGRYKEVRLRRIKNNSPEKILEHSPDLLALDNIFGLDLIGVEVTAAGRVFLANNLGGNVLVLDYQDDDQNGLIECLKFRKLRDCPVQFLGVKGAIPGQFDRPQSVAINNNGDIVVADSGNKRIQFFRITGQTVGDPIIIDFQSEPQDVVFSPDGKIFYVSSKDFKSVYGLSITNSSVNSFEFDTSSFGGFDNPDLLAKDSLGNVYVVDNSGSALKRKIYKFDKSGKNPRELPIKFNRAGALEIVQTSRGELIFVQELQASAIEAYDLNGIAKPEARWGTFGTTDGKFQKPVGLATDGQYTYVLESGKSSGFSQMSQIQMFDNQKLYGENFVASFAKKADASVSGIWYGKDISAAVVGGRRVIAVADIYTGRISLWRNYIPALTPTPTPKCRTGSNWTTCLRNIIPSIGLLPPGSTLPCGRVGQVPCLELPRISPTSTPSPTPSPTPTPKVVLQNNAPESSSSHLPAIITESQNLPWTDTRSSKKIDIVATDLDGDSLNMQISSSVWPLGIYRGACLTSAGSISCSLSGRPLRTGIYNIIVSVTDGQNTISKTLQLTIQ